MITGETARRDQKKYAHRLRKTGFLGDKSQEGFDYVFNLNIEKRQISDLTDCWLVEKMVAVFIAGPCGPGKCHIAQALGNRPCESKILWNVEVIYSLAAKF